VAPELLDLFYFEESRLTLHTFLSLEVNPGLFAYRYRFSTPHPHEHEEMRLK
jgi:hypothetical protein